MSSLDDAMQECSTKTPFGVRIIPHEYRLAIFHMPYRELRPLMDGKSVKMAISKLMSDDCISINDVQVISVHDDFMSQSFAVTVYHESFDVVPDGQKLPVLGYARLEVVD